jgi:regulator of cell morphogenesis and NO signaling
VARVHGGKAAHIVEIAKIVETLSMDLLSHMRKEEAVLFPAIRAIAEGRAAAGWIKAPVAVMEHEHDRAGALLSDLRELTCGYTPPDRACPTTRALYQGLEELERAMHMHVHLENNVLFPRALGRQAAAA